MFSRSAQFDRALEKATSQLLLEPDWDSILQICDCIRQGDVQPRYAVGGIKRKIATENPHVSMYALQVLESSVKNCGSLVHNEIATKEYMEFMKDQSKVRTDPVKGKILELIQCWSHAFRNEPGYRVVQDTYNLMKMEGFNFPVLKEADAMFMAEKAPEWKEGEVCTRCRVQFGMMQRKHHCRNCGEIFCGKCSSKASIIPRFGIEKEVRVCEACYEKLNKMAAAPGTKKSEDDLPAEYLASPLSKQSQAPVAKTEQEIMEEEELQLALALSKSEHETKEKERERLRSNYGIYGGGGNDQSSSSPPANRTPGYTPAVSAPAIDTSDMDPELARYLNRNYWQQRSVENKVPVNVSSVPSSVSTTTPSAPVVSTDPKFTSAKLPEVYQNGETDDDQAQFLHALHSSIEIFVNRMKSNSQRGRNIANDSSVQSLFNVISNMHPQLMNYLQEQEDSRTHYESLQDKLAQLRDAREALDALRDDHAEKKRREHEELERIRQIQMAQKLDIMRQKKHEYLEMQRQLHLQRLQEQEREMQMRFEQQKQLTQIRQMQAYGYPQQMYQPGIPGQSPGGSVEGSPVHLVQQPGVYMPPQGQGMPPAPGQPQTIPGYGVPGGQQPPAYTQSSQMGYQGQVPPNMAPPPQSLPPGTYQGQVPDNSMPPGGVNPAYQGAVPMGYGQNTSQAPNSGGSSLPPMGAPQGYQPEYQSFNMQSMGNALPPGSNQQVYNQPQQQQQYMPPTQQQPPPPPPQYQQGMGQMAPPQQQPQPQGQPQPPPQGQPQQQLLEAQLICFD